MLTAYVSKITSVLCPFGDCSRHDCSGFVNLTSSPLNPRRAVGKCAMDREVVLEVEISKPVDAPAQTPV